MLYFQMSEDEFNQLNRVREQWGLISSLLIGAYPSNPMEVVDSNERLPLSMRRLRRWRQLWGR